MILAPSYAVVAGPVHLWPELPQTPLFRLPRRRRAVARRQPTHEELAGLGSFFKKVAQTISRVAAAPVRLVSPKLADNLQKIDNKVIDFNDKVWDATGNLLHKAGNWTVKRLGKNWKWIVVIVAIAITIYTMGAGSTIAAHMISGMQALGHAIATGATAVAHAVGFGSGAAAAGSAATGTAAAGTAAAGTAAVSTGTSAWLTTAKLAFSAASALSQQRAKVSDLSQQQAQAMLDAQAAGYNLGAGDPQLQQALQTRAQIPGAGIPTDENGNPLLTPDQTGAGYLMPDGTVADPSDQQAARAAGRAPAASSFSSLTASPYFVPAVFGGGALLLVLLLKR